MPPAADDLFRKHSQSSDEALPLPSDRNTTNQEHDPAPKTKKKGKAAKKAAKVAAAKIVPPEDRIQPSPPLQAEPSSCLDPALDHDAAHNNVVSPPVFDALDSLAETPDNDIVYRTDTWAKSIPFGKSPPNDVIDGEFASGSPLSFPTTQEKVGGFSQPSSTSPPPRLRPLSYGNGYLSSNLSRQQSGDRQKSHSMNSPFSGPVPPPHMPQAHFYGAPEIDLPLSSGQNRSTADANFSFCAFDTISSPPSKTSRMNGNVLLAGTDGGLEVLAIEERKPRLIGKLAGLNGRVVEAKMLTCSSPNDPFASSRPHVAVVVHGPSIQPEEEGRTSSACSETNETPSVAGARQASGDRRANRDDTKFYQTRVEIYSLRGGDHIATLFATKPAACLDNIPGLPSFAPSPIGNLKIHANGNYVIVASGVSGEVYIFGIDASSHTYQCLGKTWTSVQLREARRYSTSSSSTDPDGSRNDSPHGSVPSENPILALRGRWLAVVPPSSSYKTSLHGSVPASSAQGKVFGLDTRNPPVRPAVTCATDVGEGESFFDKMARGVTQELVRGARWMGDQGLQAWNNYWKKDEPQNSTSRRSSNLMDFPQHGYTVFPPTHAQETQSASPAEPDIVSIVDLRRVEDGGETKNALFNPVATFQVPNGCSFLSFSPNGLMLLTASKKGDVQYVWDLMQAKHCRAGAFLSDDWTPSANVRQVARYARLTASSIVDVIWTAPVGDRLAIITRNGTVHVFDLPRSAFQWPPFRRARPQARKPQSQDPTADDLPDRANAANPLSAAIKLVGGRTQPILSAVRGRTPSAGPAFSGVSGFGISSAAGVRGGKVVAAGLSKSMGAATGTVNTLRHVGENRLHLSGLARDPTASRVAWISIKGQPFLGLVDNGSFRLYRIRRAVPTGKSRLSQSVIGGKELEYKLPANLQNPCGPMAIGGLSPEPTISATLALPSSNPQPSAAKVRCQPLSQAEIETNAPYQPFHTDQRVNLYIYAANCEPPVSPLPSAPTEWVFGDEVSTSKLHVRPFSAGGGDNDDDNDTVHEQHPGVVGEMENLISLGNSTGNVEEVVITTRRKKKHSSPSFPSAASGGGDIDDGFFEDDCEVLDFARDRV